jgi:hypothetical protein
LQPNLSHTFLLCRPCVATCPIQLNLHDFIVAIILVKKGQIMTIFNEQLKILIHFFF